MRKTDRLREEEKAGILRMTADTAQQAIPQGQELFVVHGARVIAGFLSRSQVDLQFRLLWRRRTSRGLKSSVKPRISLLRPGCDGFQTFNPGYSFAAVS
jgi:hypothetical protein